MLYGKIDMDGNITCFSSIQGDIIKKEGGCSQILPVFTEAPNTPAIVKHFLTVIMKAHGFTNPGEAPWVTADQPLYALFKTIQWRFPQTHGEHLIFAVLGAMDTEKAAWTCIEQVEDGSGGPTIMAEAGVTTIGVAESTVPIFHVVVTLILSVRVYCT